MAKPTAINLNDDTPAAPAGKSAVKWQASAPRTLPDGTPIRDVSAYVQEPQALAAVAHKFVVSYDAATGLFTAEQPAISDLSGFPSDPSKYLNGSGEFSTPSGGSGAPLPYPDEPPSSPDALDDEFNASPLAGKWTGPAGVTTPLGVTSAYVNYDVHTTWPSWLRARLSNTAGQMLAIRQSSNLPAGAFSVTAKFSHYGQANYTGCYLHFSSGTDGTAQQAIRAAVEWAGGTAGPSINVHFDTKDNGVWSYNRAQKPAWHVGTHFLHMTRDGSNNWGMWYSPNGLSWLNVVSGWTKAFTLASIYIELNLNNAVLDQHLGCDWIRFNWLTLP